MSDNPYETQKLLNEYLLFHYGSEEEIIRFEKNQIPSLEFPKRCVSEGLIPSALQSTKRALDLGCSVGRASFELRQYFDEVLGIDFSQSFVDAANTIQQEGKLNYQRIIQGERTEDACATTPLERSNISFEQGDALNLREDIGQFDCIFAANLIDRLPNPKAFLESIHNYLSTGGQLILTSPYTWLEEFTPKENWIGGTPETGSTFNELEKILKPNFELLRTQNLPFLIREHERKYQWSVAHCTTWMKKS